MKSQGNAVKAIKKGNVLPFESVKREAKKKEEIARRLIDRARERGYQIKSGNFQSDPSSFIRQHLLCDLAFAEAVFGKEMICGDCGKNKWGEKAYPVYYCDICLSYKDPVPSYRFHLHRFLDASFNHKEFEYLKRFIEDSQFVWVEDEDEKEEP